MQGPSSAEIRTSKANPRRQELRSGGDIGRVSARSGHYVSHALQQERGFALVLFLLLVAFGSFVVLTLYQLQSARIEADKEFTERIDQYYATESALHRAVAWINDRSEEMVSLFHRDMLYTHFERTAPSFGVNDLLEPKVATKIKLRGSNDSVLLTSNSALGVSNFPLSSNAVGETFDSNANFASQDFLEVAVKISLVDAIAAKEAKDYGANAAKMPGTDFYPVFRIDAIAPNGGTHLYLYMIGNLAQAEIAGFYGEDFVQVGQNCDSYNASDQSYSPAVVEANCPIASKGPICIRNNTKVYGSVNTLGELQTTGACGGEVCADASCSEQGPICQGAECDIIEMPEYPSFDEVCPAGQIQPAESFVSARKSIVGEGALDRCWQSWKVQGAVTLDSTTTPYYVRELDLGSIVLDPNESDGVITIVSEKIVGNNFAGVQQINAGGQASQLKLVYLGSAPLQIYGNTKLHMQLLAPNAGVTLLGNSEFHGSIVSKNLTLNGNTRVHYDESKANDRARDIEYRVRQLNQYRQ